MTWFAFKGYNSGQAIDIAGVQEKEATSLGFHGYGTQVQAQANPNDVAGFPNPLALVQVPFVNLIIKDYKAALSTQSAPGQKNASNLGLPKAISNAANGLIHDIPGVGSIDDLVNAFRNNFEHVMLRIGEVLVGGLLLYLGIKAMTTPAGQQVGTRTVRDTAHKVAKVVKKVPIK